MSLRDKIRMRTPQRGIFMALPSAMAVEIVAGARPGSTRPDFLCIDTEHSPIGPVLLTDMIRAADLCGMPALVRVRSSEVAEIAAALDAGAAGILVPHVASAATAAAAVRAARFPPEGNRGAGPARAARYIRDIPGMLETARRDTVVAVQIETVEAVTAAADILAVPGIDLAFIGPGDLGVDLATRPGITDTLEELIDSTLQAAEKAGVPAGIFTADRCASSAWFKRLAFLIEGSDVMLLSQAADAAFAPL
nr:aldolase/citrate lyase family protein [uncultured Celeribacter sp.]